MNDLEIKAFQTIVEQLQGIEVEAQKRVLAYASAMIGQTQVFGAEKVIATEDASVDEVPLKGSISNSIIMDIRTLKEEKAPSSAVEMAVLVAYYLQELAPEDDRKDSFGIVDLNKYFKQAQFRLPSRPQNVLSQAKDSGYLDKKARAQYSLNPVGYNLAAHGLPRTGVKSRKPARKPTKAPTKVLKASGKNSAKASQTSGK